METIMTGHCNYKNQLHQLIVAFVDADMISARKQCSTQFGWQNGLTLEAYLKHNISEYSGRKKMYDVSNGFSIESVVNDNGMLAFTVLDQNGRWICDDHININEQGYFVGNQSRYETITKFLFEQNSSKIKRSFAVRSQYFIPDQVVIISPKTNDIMLSQSPYEADFYHCKFSLNEDAGSAFRAKARIYCKQPVYHETKMLIFKGTNHAFFQNEMYPVIQGNQVFIDQTQLLSWSLAVQTEDGVYHHIQTPIKECYYFDALVCSATLTDALDNDWYSFNE